MAKGYVLTQDNGTSKISNFDNVVIVQSASDFPAPVAGVITLADNTLYSIGSNVSVGTDRFAIGDNTHIHGLEETLTMLTYTGTGNMFTGTNKSFMLGYLDIVCPNGTVFNLTGSGVEELEIEFVNIVGAGTIGTITGMGEVEMLYSGIVDSTVGGLSFAGTFSHISISNSAFENNAGTSLALGTATIDALSISVCDFDVNATQTGISAGAFTLAGGILLGNQFSGAGTYTSGLSTSNIYLSIFSNVGIDNSQQAGECYFNANASATAITVTGTYYKGAGTTTAGTNSQFTATANRLTYNGLKTRNFLVTIAVSVSTGNNNQVLGVQIFKGGVAVAASEQEIRQTTAGDAVTGVAKSIISLATGEYVELYVTNKTATNSVTIEYMNFTAI